ncbi:hypothetical protein [Paracoccus onubensis]|uniref:DUF3168 domain-containing protein n=1 Tax=Paracoccus onubensis TaxID=1675788 RepID=A0A418ST01_9RHOB|nr:hypothetical protein [Paracoccus onubensis]RJE84029.1 hypothetical protein D3P04_13515 [Paracoccus onubensis]
MAHYRSQYRQVALAALTAHSRFASFTRLKVWAGSIDDQTLPVIGVLTPQERREQPGKPSVTCRTLLQVVVRRLGHDDVEDQLDDDSELIEAIVSDSFLKIRQGCFLEDLSVVTNTDGHSNVATLVMSFRLTSFRKIPSLPPAP